MSSYHANYSYLPPYAMDGLQKVNERGAKEILRVADWMQNQSKLQDKVAETRKKQMTTGNHLLLIAGCPDSKPLWEDNNHDLECFACGFSQRRNKSYDYLEIPWMTKCIRKQKEQAKNNSPLLFVPLVCRVTPWVVHSAETHTMIHIARESKNVNEPLQETRPPRDGLHAPKNPLISDIIGLRAI
jgi:Zn ribbon nucleic-acid-binding protein